MTANNLWSDQIHVLQNISTNGSLSLESSVYIMLSTLLDVDASIHEDASAMIIWVWPESPTAYTLIPYVTKVYFVQCSLSATTAQAVVDMRTNSLWDPMYISQPPMQWDTYQWTSMPNNTWQAQLGQALATPVDSVYEFGLTTGYTLSKLSIIDELRFAISLSYYRNGSHILTGILCPCWA
ncbi:hypothetical protein M405DRAFT_168444 [Rhizopogon salebrosus TDB-379]|nr:hypothetical protein M405DRAFT_168444 [Rhizopogon salebrosus TDB-379]